MDDKFLSVPKKNKADIAHSVLKSICGSAPYVGQALQEILGYTFPAPIENRLHNWRELVASEFSGLVGKIQDQSEKLKDLESRFSEKAEHFRDLYIKATQSAVGTSLEKKIESLKNALLNACVGSISDSKQSIFLNYIDSFTIWHFKILNFVNDPSLAYDEDNRKKETFNSTSFLLEDYFQELKDQKTLYCLIWKDLHQKGLLQSDTPTGLVTNVWHTYTTDLGKELLDFIKSPIEMV